MWKHKNIHDYFGLKHTSAMAHQRRLNEQAINAKILVKLSRKTSLCWFICLRRCPVCRLKMAWIAACMSYFFSSQLEWGHFGRLGSRTRPQRAPDCRERDAELLPVTAHWSPDGPQGLPDWHHPRPGRRKRGGRGGGQGKGVWRWRLA